MKSFKLIVFLCILFLSNNLFAQKIGDGVILAHFNAGWNSANNVKWIYNLSDAKVKKCDIAIDTKSASKYEIVVVPTIIIFDHGKEVKRYQADISFSMKATKSQVQDKIDDILMESF